MCFCIFPYFRSDGRNLVIVEMSNEERFETFAVLVSLGVYMVDISILLVIIDVSIEFF